MLSEYLRLPNVWEMTLLLWTGTIASLFGSILYHSPEKRAALRQGLASLGERQKALFRRCRISLRTALLAMIPLGFALLGIRYYLETRPPALQPFSASALKAELQTDKIVMVLAYATWDLTSCLNLQAIESPTVSRAFRREDVIALSADLAVVDAKTRQEVDALMESVDSNTVPVTIVYPAGNRGAPIVLRDAIREKDVLQAMKAANAQ